MVSARTNRERASECLTEAQACLDQIVRHSQIGFPSSPAVVDSYFRLMAMHAAYMTEPDADWGDISDQFRK